METTLTPSQINLLAKYISQKSLKDFYNNVENQKAFHAWKAEKEKGK